MTLGLTCLVVYDPSTCQHVRDDAMTPGSPRDAGDVPMTVGMSQCDAGSVSGPHHSLMGSPDDAVVDGTTRQDVSSRQSCTRL